MSIPSDVAESDQTLLPAQWSSLIAISAFITLLLILFGLGILYHSKLALTALEQTWTSSQQASLPPSQSLLTDSTQIVLERLGCFGLCPAYQVKIFGSGRVEFYGNAYVCEKAPHPTYIDPQLVRRLMDGLNAVNFSKIPNYLSNDVFDAASANIIATSGNQSHKVEYYFGDAKAPRLLRIIEDRIDEVANTSKWIGNCSQP